jgi:hypothetical protein
MDVSHGCSLYVKSLSQEQEGVAENSNINN